MPFVPAHHRFEVCLAYPRGTSTNCQLMWGLIYAGYGSRNCRAGVRTVDLPATYFIALLRSRSEELEVRVLVATADTFHGADADHVKRLGKALGFE